MASSSPRQLAAIHPGGMLSTSDDTAMLKQIQATHAPDGREVDVKPVLQIIEEILIQVIARTVGDDVDGKTEHVDSIGKAAVFAELAFIIYKISFELSYKCGLGGGDAHAKTMGILNMLPSYSWHAKVVITLSAMAVNFGEFWLVAQLGATNTIAKSVALLKQLPDLVENHAHLKHQFDTLTKLVKAILDVTRCIVELKEQPTEHISEDTSPMPIAAYWTIRSVVACASQIAGLVGLRNEYGSTATEAGELSSLAHKMSNIHEHLQNQLPICNQYIDDNKGNSGAFLNLARLVETALVDNMKILRALIYAKEDPPPLIDGSTKKRVSLEVLRRKHVLLLISDLDLSEEEIIILDNLYKDARSRSETYYEMVWIPVVEAETWNKLGRQKFKHLRTLMPWYSVRDPLIIEPHAIKYIREVLNFTKKAILVALDPQGRLSSHNALHMYWIWGNLAFPFSLEREESLWKEELWSLELLVDGIDPIVLEWMEEGKYICLYGGEDLEWIETFTTTAIGVARVINISWEMVYVGKKNTKERMQKMINTFATRKFSYFWPNVMSIWFFWTRLESMLFSKLLHGKTVESDQILFEVMTVLSLDVNDQGWAIFYGGAHEMARVKGDTALTCLRGFEYWKEGAIRDGFFPAMNEYLKQLHRRPDQIREKIVCAECGRPMERYFLYRLRGE